MIVGRGAAKSLYATCIQAYDLIVTPQTTYQMTTAPTMKQADEILAPFRTAITRAKGPVFEFMTQGSLQNTTGPKSDRVKLASTKKGIENFVTNSLLEIRPMSIHKLQGMRPKTSTVDEWLSGDLREDPIGAIEQGAAKIDDWLIVATSSEGTVRNGSGDTIKMELMNILKGVYVNPHVSIWWYKLDDIQEVGDPSKWLKANPNLGSTVTYETYQLEVERAENAPAARNDILAKGLAFRWRALLISSHTKRLLRTERDRLTECRVPWAATCPLAMTSVLLHFYSLWQMVASGLRLAVILAILRIISFLWRCAESMTNSSRKALS